MLESLIILNKKLESILKENLQEFKISFGQYKVLKKIYSSDNNMISANNLCLLLNIDKRTLSLNLKKLEDLGYVQRIDIESDRRKKYISLSETALEFMEDMICIEYEIEDIIANSLKDKLLFEQEIERIERGLSNFFK